ncbi:MAG: hypothetical protein K0Q79_1841 [Flavipsychrobacter sp.]|jgi:O-antigen ligase|nr:hypothetical protein [Flavipsychrobacter sp.]
MLQDGSLIMSELQHIGKPLHARPNGNLAGRRFGAADKYIARLLMLSFFLPMKWQVWATMAAGVYFIIRTVQLKYAAPKQNYLWALLLGSTFLLFLLAIPFTPAEYARVARKAVEHRVTLLFMPVLFAAISPMLRQTIMKQLMYFVYGCLIICAAANASFVYHLLTDENAAALTHMAYRASMHFFMDIHPTYLSMYLCVSICIMLQVHKLEIQVRPVLLNVLLYISFLFLVALGAKTPILAMLLILVHFAWAHRRVLRTYTVLFIGLIAVAVLAYAFIPFIGQRMNEMITLLSSSSKASLTDNSVAARKAIWDIDVELVKQHWLTGVGPGRISAVMEAGSHEKALPVIYEDPHNEYVYEWLCFGIAGILIFGIALILQIWRAIRFKERLNLYLLVVFCVTFFTESVLSLQRGIMLFAIFTSLLFYNCVDKNKPL